jgi:hypothetical protein
MNLKTIKMNIVITSLSSKRDGSAGLRVETPELNSQEFTTLRDIQNTNLLATLQPFDEPDAEVVSIDKDLNKKSPSVRLRNTLYVLWKQEGITIPFEEYYRTYIEQRIINIKKKLI